MALATIMGDKTVASATSTANSTPTAPTMPQEQPNNPLHRITLQTIVTELVEHYGWEQLSHHININCFHNNPSIKSSLKFLRKTDWARKKVENLYLDTFH